MDVVDEGAAAEARAEMAEWADQQPEPEAARRALARFEELVGMLKEPIDQQWFRKRCDAWEREDGELTTEDMHAMIRELEQRLALA